MRKKVTLSLVYRLARFQSDVFQLGHRILDAQTVTHLLDFAEQTRVNATL